MADLPDDVALRSVITAMREELVRIEERLALFGQGDRQRPDPLAALLPSLRQVADTLAVLGFGQPRKVILDQVAVLQSLVQGTRAADDSLLPDVAGALLYVEATLAGRIGSLEPNSLQASAPASGITPRLELAQIHRLVIGEARQCLRQAKEAIQALAGGSDSGHSALASERLTEVRGALAMLSLNRAAALVQACRENLERAWPQARADELTDAISSIDYYLDQLENQPDLPDESLLDLAEDGLMLLGMDPPVSDLNAQGGREPAWVAPRAEDSLLEVFEGEAQTHLASLAAFLANAPAEGGPASDALLRALHTLKGSAHAVGVLAVADLAAALDHLARAFKARGIPLGAEELGLLAAAVSLLRSQPIGRTPLPGAIELVASIQAREATRLAQPLASPGRHVAQSRVDFLEQGMDGLLDAEAVLRHWREHPSERQGLDRLLEGLTAFGQNAALADLHPIDALCEALLDLYGAVEDSSLAAGPRFFDEAERAQEALVDMLDQLAAGQDVQPDPARLRALRELLEEGLAPDAMGHVGAAGQRIDDLALATRRLQAEAEPPPLAIEAPLEAPLEAPGEDSELLAIFLEEATDILDSLALALERWQAAPDNLLEAEHLLRDLHTLKGGARMVEIAPIGDWVHELEFLHESIASGTLSPSEPLFDLLRQAHDRLAAMLDAVRARRALPATDDLLERIRQFSGPSLPSNAAAPAEPPLAPSADAVPMASERATGDQVKVAAELLEDLGNLAGESTLLHGRVTQQVDDAQATLNEMEMTLVRLREQLRRLDSEAPGRLPGHELGIQRAGYEEFDALEMDRHSQLQQLSSALFESASDLLDLKETLVDRHQQAQRLLQAQGRVHTELQEGLMRTRMVPFERLLPRLQRLVRHVSGELGKQVELDIDNAQGEMDRSVLERLIAPLEHMVRNAVDHGLESPARRQALGKPALGSIRLELRQDGGDMLIQLSDDGAGVPLAAVRAKAIKRGLLDPHSNISDHDVLQFILQPGFSTAAKITQISGRGLGMDVVHEEVKQLGGSMTIDSRAGQGACFTIRLPLTVSVNRALMVQCGEEQYAVALNTVEGIVRVMPAELAACYQQSPPRYSYGGKTYELRYLGHLLAGQAPQLTAPTQALPVLLVRAHGQRVAVQVDAVAGSREIVVQGLGPQFAGVPGLAGATILGDGRVVLILDLLGQLRAAQARHASPAGFTAPNEPPPPRPLLVMVVDDSITVRKVTGRLLERHGMQVLTARDGIDAMALLDAQRPDILLLDIEMPRMDGFEVAARVRQDPRLKHLPIIMITSRTGQKHRDRARAIGVNDYFGKPFQDHLLLDSIARWSSRHA
jgi:chemosensory pili system protein ChpA (sensor histidine kinase/response regulator)